jgi:perosamine synthetase
MFSRQMPARSPIPGRVLPKISLQALALGDDPRTRVRDLLLQRYHADGCALVGSGTQALQTALTLAAGGAIAPVLMPAYSCYEVASAAVGANVNVVLYDVDVQTLEPDWESVIAAASNGACALVVAPLYGLPLDWDRAKVVAQKLGVLLVADVAQAHGTMWRGVPAGANADMTVVSFGRGKGWTGAGGGTLLWRGERARNAASGHQLETTQHGFAVEARSIAKAGSQWLLGRRSLYGLPAAMPFLKLGETVYHDPSSPTAMTRASAALLLETEGSATAEVLQRRRNAQRYTELLRDAGIDEDAITGALLDDDSGALRFPFRVKDAAATLRRTAAGRLGAARGYPLPLRELPALRAHIQNEVTPLKGAEMLAREVITLPTHSQVDPRDIHRLVSLLVSETRMPKGVATVRQTAGFSQ